MDQKAGKGGGTEPGGPGQEGQAEGTVEIKQKKSWLREYVSRFSRPARLLLQILKTDAEPEVAHSTKGRRIDPKKLWTNPFGRIFEKMLYQETRPDLHLGLSLDVSGSVQGNEVIKEGFEEMMRFFSSLMFAAGRAIPACVICRYHK